MREFTTGATRNDDTNKFDYEGFLSPLVLHRYAEYMHSHRLQHDGKLRDSDNWQKGIPITQYLKSLVRHVFDLWRTMRGIPCYAPEDKENITLLTVEDLACAIIFNIHGLLLETLKRRPENGRYVCTLE